jgi:phosphoglycolate phosphatase
VRLAIFDLDGTLIDSVGFIVETVATAFTAVNEPVPEERLIRSISGITMHEALAILSPAASPARRDELLDSYRRHYRQQAGVAREPLFGGALEALDRLGADPGTILAVATGKGYNGAITLLERHGILSRFQSVQTPDHNRGKPDPQMIETAIARAGVGRGEAVMIGDTIHDMRMARAARVKAIGVAWGYHEVDELWREGADVVIERFDDLDGAIAELLRGVDA